MNFAYLLWNEDIEPWDSHTDINPIRNLTNLLSNNKNLSEILTLKPDDGFPSSNKEDSGYILLLIALIIAGSITQDSAMDLMCEALNDMQKDQADEDFDYGALTRQWVNNIIMNDGGLLDSLPPYLALLISRIYKKFTESENEGMSLADQISDRLRIGYGDSERSA